jgi:putative nucleotide binding protein
MSYRRNQSRRRPSSGSLKKYEEEAIVLEVITPDMNRRRGKYSDETIIQVVGTAWFTLLEIIPEESNTLMLGDRIKLSKDDRDNVKTIIGRITHDDLTPVGELQLSQAIDQIMNEDEKRFVNWLNKSTPISLRLHSLHLIKGIGPKSLKIILDERKVVPFTTYEDFEERTGVSNIKGLIKQRILDEMTDETEKHHLFTRGMKKERR